MRKLSEIQTAVTELAWFTRSMEELHDIEYHGRPIADEAVFDRMMERCNKLEDKYGSDDLAGKLAALRWVLGGDDWGIDT